jgi:hypothetical protein
MQQESLMAMVVLGFILLVKNIPCQIKTGRSPITKKDYKNG